MRIQNLEQSDLQEASRLFADSYLRQRESVPILDANLGSPENVLPKLQSLLERHPGVAVFEGSEMLGYMAGLQLDDFLGVYKGAYCPEWAHASAEKDAFDIYRLMYRELGQRWVGDGCLTHAINFMEHAADAWEAFVWNGFGAICIDAVRPVQPLNVQAPKGLSISEMEEKHIPAWLPMVHDQTRHLARSPAFIPYLEKESPKELAGFLEKPGNHAWMAWLDGAPVGYMRTTPVGNGAAWVVNGEKKFAINGAYVAPEARGSGIAVALLSRIMDWGAENGFARCSVDFEATNPEACRFWLSHFQPVCRSMIRRLDERIINSI